jgi:glycosyltransferase involved in cell wall biosynthesis
MKVAIHNAARVWGGNEKWMGMLSAGLAARGHDVVVSCRAGGEVERRCREAGVRTTSVRPGVELDVVRAARFAAWLRAERPDVLLLTSWTATLPASFAARIAGVPRVVVRLGVHRTVCAWHHAVAFRRWVDALIVNAPEVRDGWLAAAPWYPARHVHLVLNGILPRGPVDRAAARARLGAETGVSPDAVLVGAAGHATHRKGFDLLVDALAAATDARLHAVIAGDGPELPALRARAARLGISDRVTFLGHRTDVPDVLVGCDVFALPSRCEGMANVMLEAMAAGTPVVAAEISGVARALGADDGRPPAGWTFPADDAAALARALSHVAGADPSAVRARTAEAAWRVEHRFGADRMVDEALAVLAGRPLPRPALSPRPPRRGTPVHAAPA